MTSVKIVTVDYYMSYPVKDLDVCYSEFRGTEVRQVPVLQIFGSTREGIKTCLHIHGILPYIYIPYDGVEPAASMSYKLAAEIDKTLNISLGQATSNSCFVHNIVLVSGIPLYGYHEKEHQFFKIFFYNPMIVKRVCSLLENGAILGKRFQPHESHINYVLQFMIDYNLQGMNYINLSRVMYRIDTENPKSLENIPSQLILPVTVQRRSFCRLECDALARDIMNIEEVSSGQLAVNPGLAALWEDERQRRRNNEVDSQISFCLTQDRPKPKSTATHRLFKQKLIEKLASPSAHSDDSVSELERSVYPAETPDDVELLNASTVLSNALTTPSNESMTNASALESTSAEAVVMDQADMHMLQLLEELKAVADDTELDESVVDNSQQQPQDAELFTLLQQLRERVNVEEDSILSQTVVEHAASSSDEEDEHNLSLPLVKDSEIVENNEQDDDSVWENSFWDENCQIPQVDGQYDSSTESDIEENNNQDGKKYRNFSQRRAISLEASDSSDHSQEEIQITSAERSEERSESTDETTDTSDETDSSLETRSSKIVTRSQKHAIDEKTVASDVTISSTESISSFSNETSSRIMKKLNKFTANSLRRMRRVQRIMQVCSVSSDHLNDEQVCFEPDPRTVKEPKVVTQLSTSREIAEKLRSLEYQVKRLEKRVARYSAEPSSLSLDTPREEQDIIERDVTNSVEESVSCFQDNGRYVVNSSTDSEHSCQSFESANASSGTNNSSTQISNLVKVTAQIHFTGNVSDASDENMTHNNNDLPINSRSITHNRNNLPINTRSCTPMEHQHSQSPVNIMIVDNPVLRTNTPRAVESPDTLPNSTPRSETFTASNVTSPNSTPHNQTCTARVVTSPNFTAHNQTSTARDVTSPRINEETIVTRLNTSNVATQTPVYHTSLAAEFNKATIVNLIHRLRAENARAQNTTSPDEVIVISEEEEPRISHKTCMRMNLDGVGDTSNSSGLSSAEKQYSITRRSALANKSKTSNKSKQEMDSIVISSDSDNTSDNGVNSVRRLTRKQSRTEQKLKSKSEKLLTKQLRVSLVPLECLVTPGKTKSNVKINKPASPTKLELSKTTSNNLNNGQVKSRNSKRVTKQNIVKNSTNTEDVTKKHKENSTFKYSALTVTLRSPKSKKPVDSSSEPNRKRAKIADEILCEPSSSKDTKTDDDGIGGELQMNGIMPVIQNTKPVKKTEIRSLKSKTTCDIASQSNSEPTSSIVRQPTVCDSSKVKKQLFTSSPRKTIVVNINTDTNQTFVEEARMCSYVKSRRNNRNKQSDEQQQCVQIQQLTDLIAKEENFLDEIDRIYAQPQPDGSKMEDDDNDINLLPEAVPPVDIFEPDHRDDTSTCEAYSDANSAANLASFLQDIANRNITSNASDTCSLNDQRNGENTHLNTPFVCTDFNNSPETRPHRVQRKNSITCIYYTADNDLTVSELYDLQSGFIPMPCSSWDTDQYVRQCVLFHHDTNLPMAGSNNPQVFVPDRDGERDANEQDAIRQSLEDEYARQKADVERMEYDPDCDGEPLVEEPPFVSNESLPFAPNKERVDSDILLADDVEFVKDDRAPFSHLLSQVSMKDDENEEEVDEFDLLQTRSVSPDTDNLHTPDPLSLSGDSQAVNKTQLFGYISEIMASRNNSNHSPSPVINGDIHNVTSGDEDDDTIIEATPPKSQNFTGRQPAANATGAVLMPRYKPPTRLDVINSLAEYNIPECRYQQPFYSNVADVTGKMDVGHNVLKIPSNTILDLEEFKSCTGFPGLDTWRREKFKELYPDADVSKINFHIAFAGQSEVVMEPGAEPPSRQEIEQWVEMKKQAASVKDSPTKLPKPRITIPLSPSGDMDDSMSETMTLTPCTPDVPSPVSSQSTVEVSQTTPQHCSSLLQRKATGNLQRRVLFSQTNKSLSSVATEATGAKQKLNFSDTSVYNNSHQITGVHLDSEFKVEQENLQHARALCEPQNLTVMVVELYVRTRGELYPDPQYDAVRAIFYSILNDVPAADVDLPREKTGILVVNTLDGSTDMTPKYLLDGSGVSCVVTYVESEADLMTEFVKLVRKWDPDIFAGYEIEMHSWGYLIDRCSVIGINLASQISRVNPAVVKMRPNDTGDNGGSKDIQLVGRIILDVWRLLRHEVALQSYTFENIMYHILHMRVPKFSYQRLTFFWEHKSNFYRYITAKYYILRVKSVLKLLDQLDLIGRTSELAKLFGIQFYEVLSRGSQFRVESMMLRLAKPLNYIPVSPSVQQRAKMRAPEFLPLIFEPESRFYVDPVIVLDFQSLYPSIIIAYNYCFSTCIGRVEMLGTNQPFEFGACQLKVPRATLRNLEHKLNFSPCGVGYVKPEVRQGILPRMLKEILETRLMVKSSMKENKDNKLLQRVLHSRQLGLKLIANVTYGYTAANFSGRMPCIEVGDSVVSKGRETLERAIKLIEQTPRWRAKVVYGDTDSLFVMVAGRSKDEAFRIGAEIAEAVTNDNPAPVKLKLEKVFLPCILQTKKRYVGYMYESAEQQEPEYCAKGIETVRRDGCPAVAKMLENTLRTLFETRDVSLVKRYVCRQFSKLLTGRVSIQDLTFAREYRGASGYRPGACVPALELARRWAVTDKRREPRRGERVPYVIVNGPPGLPLIRLVRCPRELLADPSRLRPNAVYYITRVIAPALNRCFTLIGADVLTWYNEMPRRQLQVLPTEDTHSEKIKKSTISQYFATMSCAVCGQQTRDGLCDACSKNPQHSLVVLYTKVNNWERTYDEVSLICQSCCGRKEFTDCNSLDCPVLYRLNQVGRDLKQVPYVRNQIAKLDG